MGHLIHPCTAITKNGETEVRIVIDLNINLITGSVETGKKSLDLLGEQEKPTWEIPTFTSVEKINFGKKEVSN